VAGIERDSLLGIHRALFPKNLPLDFIHIGHLSQALLKQYKLVYVPYPLMLPESAAASFEEYVRNGGTLVAEARLGWNNERGYAADRIPGMGLWKVMGCRETAVETGAKGRTILHWTSTEIPGLQPGIALAARWYEETLEPLSQTARVIAQFANGRPAAIVSQYGQGKTLMLGSYVSAAYQTTPSPEAAQFFASLVRWAGVDWPVETSGGDLEVRTLESGSDTLVFVFNHGSQPADAAVALRSLHPAKAVDLVTGEVVDPNSLKHHLAPSDVWVLRLSRS
jgi:beta-galactosidase